MNKVNDKTTLIRTLKIDDKIITHKEEISNNFCDYFTNVGPNLANNIPPPNKPFHSHLGNRINRSIFIHPTDEEEINKIIIKMKPKASTGHDKLSSKLIKQLKDELKYPICLLINKSIDSGTFPDQYKLAEVIPIHKSKEKYSLN